MAKNERKRFERKMKKVLKYIQRTGDLPDELDDYTKECLFHCIAEKHYVTGVVALRMAAGNIVFEISEKGPVLTKEGLDFCWKPIPWEAGVNIALSIITAVSIILNIVQAIW